MDVGAPRLKRVPASEARPVHALLPQRPVHPLHQLLVVLPPEDVVALVQDVHGLTVRHELADLLRHLDGTQ